MKKLKLLERHLQSAYGLTPEAYRAKWGLPASYPMVAPAYAEKQSALAYWIGLGRKASGSRTAQGLDDQAEEQTANASKVTKLRERKCGRIKRKE